MSTNVEPALQLPASTPGHQSQIPLPSEQSNKFRRSSSDCQGMCGGRKFLSNIHLAVNNEPEASQVGDYKKSDFNQSESEEKDKEEGTENGHSIVMYNPQEKEDDQSEGVSVQVDKTKKPKKCFNQMCTSTKLYKRIKSKIETSKYRSLCRTCHANYTNNQFCQFCQQIYDNTVNEDDDLNWIGCDTCQRWNHIDCQTQNRLLDAAKIKQQNGRYECLTCTNKAKQKADVKRSRHIKQDYDNTYGYQRANPNTNTNNNKKKTSRQLVNQQRNLVYINENQNYINVFNRHKEVMPALEQLLHNINCRLSITDEQIRQDLNRMRSVLSSQKNNQICSEDQDEKKKRRKK